MRICLQAEALLAAGIECELRSDTCVARAETIESRLRDLMLAAQNTGDGKGEVLTQAVQGKENFTTDESALNEAVATLFSEQGGHCSHMQAQTRLCRALFDYVV
jgi:hypothetical protein